MAQEQEAIDMVTIEMLNDLTYGEEIKLNDKFCLYHYTEDDLVVFNDSEEWEELYVVQWDNETNEITFEKC
jgi:translation elongation factor P/translation initiation factor 5A